MDQHCFRLLFVINFSPAIANGGFFRPNSYLILSTLTSRIIHHEAPKGLPKYISKANHE